MPAFDFVFMILGVAAIISFTILAFPFVETAANKWRDR